MCAAHEKSRRLTRGKGILRRRRETSFDFSLRFTARPGHLDSIELHTLTLSPASGASLQDAPAVPSGDAEASLVGGRLLSGFCLESAGSQCLPLMQALDTDELMDTSPVCDDLMDTSPVLEREQGMAAFVSIPGMLTIAAVL